MTRLRGSTMTAAAACVALLFTGLAHAETFSFTSTSETTSQMAVPVPNGNGRVATNFWSKGSSTVVDSKRGDLSSTFVCSGGTNPPTETYDVRTLCDVTGKNGDNFSILAGCYFLNKERTESTCVGRLVGKAGAYKDRRGSITWNQKQTGEGASASTGAGVWNE